MRNRHAQRGFTLVEVMIAVAIVGILAAVAYPSYLSHVRKQRRADAQILLMEIASRQQQYLLDTRAYADGETLEELQAELKFPNPPARFSNHYTLETPVYMSSPASFTYRFTATGDQANDTQCTFLQITSSGEKSPQACW